MARCPAIGKVGQNASYVILAPPSQWELSRITACHPSDDGLTRIVIVETNHSDTSDQL